MKRRSFLALPAAAWAQEQWESLFDGHSLRGWRWARPGENFQPSWSVRDGLLCATPQQGRPVYLLTEATFQDFDLRFSWRTERGGNSGIKYRIQMYGDSTRRIEPVGLEYQITDDVSNPDALSTPTHTAGAIYDYVAPAKSKGAQPGVWHTARILARGLHIEHWLDEECVVNIDLDSERASREFSQSKRASREMLRRQEKRDSPLAFQLHDEVVCFRDIKIRRLSPAGR